MSSHTTMLCSCSFLLINICGQRYGHFMVLHSPIEAKTLDQQIYWVLLFLKVMDDPYGPAAKRALASYPTLASFMGNGLPDGCAVQAHLEELTRLNCQQDLVELDSVPESDQSKTARRNALCSWLSLWTSKRRSIRSITILNLDGSRPVSIDGSAENLRLHWSKVFSEKEVKLQMATSSIGGFIQSSPDDIEWFKSYDDLCGIIHSRKDTGNGPDGIVYSFWKAIPDDWKAKLYNLYVYLWNGAPPAEDFNYSKLVLPPKGVEPGDSSMAAIRAANKVRPISLSNTDSKHISAMTAIPLCEMASRIIAALATGGISGRQFTDHIIDLEAKLIRFVMQRKERAGIISLDQEALFQTSPGNTYSTY